MYDAGWVVTSGDKLVKCMAPLQCVGLRNLAGMSDEGAICLFLSREEAEAALAELDPCIRASFRVMEVLVTEPSAVQEPRIRFFDVVVFSRGRGSFVKGRTKEVAHEDTCHRCGVCIHCSKEEYCHGDRNYRHHMYEEIY